MIHIGLSQLVESLFRIPNQIPSSLLASISGVDSVLSSSRGSIMPVKIRMDYLVLRSHSLLLLSSGVWDRVGNRSYRENEKKICERKKEMGRMGWYDISARNSRERETESVIHLDSEKRVRVYPYISEADGIEMIIKDRDYHQQHKLKSFRLHIYIYIHIHTQVHTFENESEARSIQSHLPPLPYFIHLYTNVEHLIPKESWHKILKENAAGLEDVNNGLQKRHIPTSQQG